MLMSSCDIPEVRLSWVSSQDYRNLAEALSVGCAWRNSTIYLRHCFMSAFVEKTTWPLWLDVHDPAGLGIHPQATSLAVASSAVLGRVGLDPAALR